MGLIFSMTNKLTTNAYTIKHKFIKIQITPQNKEFGNSELLKAQK